MSEIELFCGDARFWSGRPVDLILTNPYASLPYWLLGEIPKIISLHHPDGAPRDARIRKAEDWIGGQLDHLSDWGARNAVYVCHLPFRQIDLRMLEVDGADAPTNVGWFPLELPMRLLALYRDKLPPLPTIWDGFCGRGTVGKACQQMGFDYIGIDIDPSRIVLAKKYLGV